MNWWRRLMLVNQLAFLVKMWPVVKDELNPFMDHMKGQAETFALNNPNPLVKQWANTFREILREF